MKGVRSPPVDAEYSYKSKDDWVNAVEGFARAIGVGELGENSIMESDQQKRNSIERTVDIVAAFVSKNQIKANDLGDLIATTYSALEGLLSLKEPGVAVVEQKPAVAPKKSVTPDFIICLEDGQQFKSLKRHLRTKYGMSPDQYRAKWGLAKDYPMVAPNYAEARSNLAKASGLGQTGGRPKSKTKSKAPAKAKS